jgi:hypothetical protein
MACDSTKICGWITALSQLTVAAVILWVGVQITIHLERMVDSWEKMALNIEMMEADVRSMDKRMWEMNNRLGGMRQRMSPWGMMMP